MAGWTVVPEQSGASAWTVVPEPPKGAFERYWEGLKANVPSIQGGLGTSAESTIQQFTNAHLPTWEELKASFRASPVGKAISGDVAGGLGAATPTIAMGLAAANPELIPNAAAAGVRGAARAAQIAIDKGVPGAVVGGMVGHALDLPGATAAGALIGRELSPKFTVPGQNFGAAPAPSATVAPETVTATAPVRPGPVKATRSPQPSTVNWQSFTGGATATPETPAPAPKATSSTDAQDLARALGLKNAQQAEQRYGKDSWAKMVAGGEHEVPAAAIQDAVTAAVDARVPAGPVNDAATVAAGRAVAAGDTAQAQAVVNAAQNVSVNPQLRWEDILDDKVWAERMRNDVDSAENAYWTYKSRLTRAGSSADVTKGSLLTPEQIVASMPAPAGTMEANKLLGYQNRPTIAQATEARNQAMSGVTAAKLKDFVRMYYGEGKELQIRPNQ